MALARGKAGAVIWNAHLQDESLAIEDGADGDEATADADENDGEDAEDVSAGEEGGEGEEGEGEDEDEEAVDWDMVYESVVAETVDVGTAKKLGVPAPDDSEKVGGHSFLCIHSSGVVHAGLGCTWCLRTAAKCTAATLPVQDYEDVSEGDEEAEPEEVGESGKRRQAQGGAPSRPAKKAKGAFVVEAVGSDDESKPAKKVRGVRFGSFRAFLVLASA
jgi:hypothetical protein